MANDIAELRGILFDTLRDLRSKEAPMDIDRAKAVTDVAQAIINSAKVEVDHLKVTGGQGSGFIVAPESDSRPQVTNTATGTKTVTQMHGATVTQHKLR